jgi:hypothetical protein
MFVLEVIGKVCSEARNLSLEVVELSLCEWQLSRAIKTELKVKRIARSDHTRAFTPSSSLRSKQLAFGSDCVQ